MIDARAVRQKGKSPVGLVLGLTLNVKGVLCNEKAFD